MNVLCLVFAILSFLGMCLGFLPCIGALNWLNIPFAVVGLILSIIAVATIKPGESKGGGIAGIICCVLAIVVGFLRLLLGGGVL